jgi:hypothetical protein
MNNPGLTFRGDHEEPKQRPAAKQQLIDAFG